MNTKIIYFVIIILLFCAIGCEHSKELMPSQGTEINTPVVQKPPERNGMLVLPYPSNEISLSIKKESNAQQLASNNYIGGFWRYPASSQRWIRDNSFIAYFTDEAAGIETYVSNAIDGETWSAEAIAPDGSITRWDNMVFRSSSGSQQNCFITPWWTECGTTSIAVLWYADIKCAAPGTWTMNFYNNSIMFGTMTFELKSRIEPGRVPSGTTFNQLAYNSPYDNICRGGINGKKSVPCDGINTVPWNISEKGCFLTASAMVLKYHGVDTNPLELNNWLSNYRNRKGNLLGFTKDGKVAWDGVAQFASTKGVNISPGNTTYSNNQLLNMICNYGPIIIGTKLDPDSMPQHWVVATGWDHLNNTFLINDPSGGKETTLLAEAKYNNQFNIIRLFEGPNNFSSVNRAGILIRLHSPAEFILTDPQGRRLGRDPIKNIRYNEIPKGGYNIVGLADATDPNADPDWSVELDIRNPTDGDYNLQVIGKESGKYLLSIHATDLELNGSAADFENIPIDRGIVHSYSFAYSKSVGSEIKVVGGFDGGGQRPKDVNKFLSYGNPSESQTTLPIGTTVFPLQIFYGSTIIPNTFKAELNSTNITSLFNPVPDQCQVVNLNLVAGRNVLILSVNGQLPTRIATDTDRLIFKVQ